MWYVVIRQSMVRGDTTVYGAPNGVSAPQTKPQICTSVAANREDCISAETREGLTVGGLNREEGLVCMGSRGVRLGWWSWEPRGTRPRGKREYSPQDPMHTLCSVIITNTSTSTNIIIIYHR